MNPVSITYETNKKMAFWNYFQIIETQTKEKADETGRTEDEAAKVKAIAEEKAKLEVEAKAKLEAEIEKEAKAEKQSQEKSYKNYYKALAEKKAKLKSEDNEKLGMEEQTKVQDQGSFEIDQNNGLATVASIACTSTLSAPAGLTGNIHLQWFT